MERVPSTTNEEDGMIVWCSQQLRKDNLLEQLAIVAFLANVDADLYQIAMSQDTQLFDRAFSHFALAI